jgi:hypothetical protein
LGGIHGDEKVYHYDIMGHKSTCCPILLWHFGQGICSTHIVKCVPILEMHQTKHHGGNMQWFSSSVIKDNMRVKAYYDVNKKLS